jgi:hypothetical protein
MTNSLYADIEEWLDRLPDAERARCVRDSIILKADDDGMRPPVRGHVLGCRLLPDSDAERAQLRVVRQVGAACIQPGEWNELP